MFTCKKIALIACTCVALSGTTMAGSDELFPNPTKQAPTTILEVPKGHEGEKQHEEPKPEHSEQPSHEACGCIPVSVRGDATYCVTGPVCAGNGQAPTGTSCPKKGDKAKESCNVNFPSSRDGDCYAPKDAECQNPEGIWMCVYPGDMPQAGKDIPFEQSPIPITNPTPKFPDQPAPPTPVVPDFVKPQPENPKGEISNPPKTPEEQIPENVMPSSKPVHQEMHEQVSSPGGEGSD